MKWRSNVNDSHMKSLVALNLSKAFSDALQEISNESLRQLLELHVDNSLLINPIKSKTMLLGNANPFGSHLRIPIGYYSYSITHPQVLYGLKVAAGATASNFLKLSRVVNSIVRYVHGLRAREHGFEDVKQFLGCTFGTFSLWLKGGVPLNPCPEFVFMSSTRNPQVSVPLS
uniref:Uncharacterized protein n=1 Tax=Glossina palpalis gambiensis TaxID=67801 RepID=A0A1B0B0M2_9MUSC